MANYVNVQKQEYADLQAGLEAIHQKVLADEESVRTCIDGLMELEGGFYVGQISNKVQEIFQTVKGLSVCFWMPYKIMM